MTLSQIVNTIGLIFGMIGVTLIFIWGPPQPQLDEGIGIGLEDGTVLSDGRTVAQHNQAIKSRRFRHTLFSRVGLAFVFLGFLAQLIAMQLT